MQKFFQYVKPLLIALPHRGNLKNKNMKKVVVIVFAFIISMGISWAQADQAVKVKKSAVERAEAFTKRMTKNLNLEATQIERFKILNLDRFKQIEEARASFGGDKKQISTKLKEINDAYFSNAKGVLTPEQFTKFQEMKEDMKEKAIARREAKKG